MSRVIFITLLSLCLLLPFFGCGEEEPSQVESAGTENQPENTEAVSEAPVDSPDIENFTGYFTYGPRVSMFKNAPDGEYYWIKDVPDDLRDRYMEYHSMEGDPIFAVVEGEVETAEDKDVPDNYPGFMVIENVLETNYLTRENQPFELDYRCFGQEPFWNVDILSGDEVVFRDVGLGAVSFFTWAEPEIDGDTIRYELEHSHGMHDEGTMIIEITKEECIDSMSGQEYEYSSTVKIGDLTFRGCAEKP